NGVVLCAFRRGSFSNKHPEARAHYARGRAASLEETTTRHNRRTRHTKVHVSDGVGQNLPSWRSLRQPCVLTRRNSFSPERANSHLNCAHAFGQIPPDLWRYDPW